MLEGLRKVLISTLIAMVVGAVFGLLVGVMVENVLLWIVVMAGAGAMLGIAFGYGLLPES